MRKPQVYLIHFDQPIGSDGHMAQHYIGFTQNLVTRLRHHKAGTGAYIMAAVSRQGIPWNVVRTWDVATKDEGYALESKLKACHNHKLLCPICNPNGKRGTNGLSK